MYRPATSISQGPAISPPLASSNSGASCSSREGMRSELCRRRGGARGSGASPSTRGGGKSKSRAAAYSSSATSIRTTCTWSSGASPCTRRSTAERPAVARHPNFAAARPATHEPAPGCVSMATTASRGSTAFAPGDTVPSGARPAAAVSSCATAAAPAAATAGLPSSKASPSLSAHCTEVSTSCGAEDAAMAASTAGLLTARPTASTAAALTSGSACPRHPPSRDARSARKNAGGLLPSFEPSWVLSCALSTVLSGAAALVEMASFRAARLAAMPVAAMPAEGALEGMPEALPFCWPPGI
mmetsp:Transcript_8835/g.26447  ORF Transcript_8835/g.26447 Transcript_8835/m.26447 type:complete len:300 (-) Transcript_8835:1982-2881(-)